MHNACMAYKSANTKSQQIRELPDTLYGALQRQAESERRSLAQEATELLAKQLGLDSSERERRQALIASFPGIKRDTKESSVVEMLREDRNR